MKRIALGLMLLCGVIHAGPRIASSNAPVKTDSDGLGIWKMVLSDTNGNTANGNLKEQWTILSIANYSLTGTVHINLTVTAGSSGVMKYKFTAVGPSAGFYHATAPNATWVGPQGYYAVSTTPIVDDNLAPGTHLLLSATAAALTVTVQVEISKLTPVNP